MTSAHLDPVPVTVRVPGKVNLELLVGPLRPDGFHTLSTVFQAVSLHDDVTVGVADEWGCTVTGALADGVPQDDDNLAVRAAKLLADECDIDEPAHITIRKGIPVAGGMAGGSADAAAALVACDRLWDLGLTKEELEEYAAHLGSDIPFLVAGGTAVGSGRGEALVPVLARGNYHWVFALAEGGLSTPTVFAELDRMRGDRDVPEPTPTRELATHLRNDLQAAAISLRPELQTVIDEGLEFGALAGIVSGSGPTIAFLVEGLEAGLDLAVALTASGAVRDVRRASGPVHGAHVIPSPVD
jgi:4-diphosphocytidyl-2-C-methyl-D-erythritol kinase